MALNVAVQMDPIERINIRGDSTFALLLEAQARGLAVLASRVGGIDEAVEDGRTGRLIGAGDIDALSNALLDLARHPQTRGLFGAAALEQVRRTGDAEAGYDSIATLLRERVSG